MQTKPPVLATAIQAYRDAFAAIRAMPFVTAVAFAATIGQSVVESALVAPVAAERTLFEELMALFLGAVWSFLFAPFLIAVHRHVLLGEVTAHYRLETGNPRFMRFFYWSFGLFALFSMVSIVSALFGAENPVGAVLAVIGAVVAIVVAIRIVVLFPAIAVDAPNATFNNAFADTKGSMLRIVGIMLVAALPALTAALLTATLVIGSMTDRGGLGVAGAVLFAASSVFFGAVFVAVASRLYQALADRLK